MTCRAHASRGALLIQLPSPSGQHDATTFPATPGTGHSQLVARLPWVFWARPAKALPLRMSCRQRRQRLTSEERPGPAWALPPFHGGTLNQLHPLASVCGRRRLGAVMLRPLRLGSPLSCPHPSLQQSPLHPSPPGTAACWLLKPQVSPTKHTHWGGTWEEELGYLCCTTFCKFLNLGKAFFFFDKLFGG